MKRGRWHEPMRKKRRQDITGFERRSCISKVRLREFDAKKLARKRDLRAYSCHFCKGWHLTSMVSE